MQIVQPLLSHKAARIRPVWKHLTPAQDKSDRFPKHTVERR